MLHKFQQAKRELQNLMRGESVILGNDKKILDFETVEGQDPFRVRLEVRKEDTERYGIPMHIVEIRVEGAWYPFDFLENGHRPTYVEKNAALRPALDYMRDTLRPVILDLVQSRAPLSSAILHYTEIFCNDDDTFCRLEFPSKETPNNFYPAVEYAEVAALFQRVRDKLYSIVPEIKARIPNDKEAYPCQDILHIMEREINKPKRNPPPSSDVGFTRHSCLH